MSPKVRAWVTMVLVSAALGGAALPVRSQQNVTTFSVTALGPNGQAVPAVACFFGPHQVSFHTQTRAAGNLMGKVPIEPGTYEVEIWAEGYRPRRLLGVAVPTGKHFELETHLQPGDELDETGIPPSTNTELTLGSVEGRVLAGTRSCQRIEIAARARDLDGPLYTFDISHTKEGTSSGRGTSSNNGRRLRFESIFNRYMGGHFRIRDMIAGVYDLQVYGDPGFQPQFIPGVEIRAGVHTVLNLKLNPGEEPELVRKPSVRYKALIPGS